MHAHRTFADLIRRTWRVPVIAVRKRPAWPRASNIMATRFGLVGGFSTVQPEGLPESSRGSKRSADPRNRSIKDSHPEGVPANAVTLSGSNTFTF